MLEIIFTRRAFQVESLDVHSGVRNRFNLRNLIHVRVAKRLLSLVG